MRTLTLAVASREATTARALAAFAGEPQGARLSFASIDLLWRVLNPKRPAILRAMTGAGALSICQVVHALRRATSPAQGLARVLRSPLRIVPGAYREIVAAGATLRY